MLDIRFKRAHNIHILKERKENQMSHPVNDQIADQVSDQVCGMSDIQVLNQLLARGVESPMDAEIDKDLIMDCKRDQLMEFLFNEWMEQ